MKKILHFTLKVLKITLIVLVLLYAAAYIYITLNKEKIINQVTEEISNRINGNVSIQNADISFFKSFPHLAVHLQGLAVTDSLYKFHKHRFLEVADVFANLSVKKLLLKESPLSEIRISDGSIFLYTDSTGYSNSYLLQSKKDPEGGPKKTEKSVILNRILMKHIRFTLLDENREKFHDFVIDQIAVKLDDAPEKLVMNVDANLLVRSLAFNLPKGTFLKDASFTGDFKMEYGKLTQVLSFDEINVKLSGQPFMLSGAFDLGDKNPVFSLKVQSDALLYESVKKLLPERIAASLSKVSVSSTINASAQLNGPLKGGEPYITVLWKVNNADLKTQFLDFDHASFTGFYKNQVNAALPRKDPNSVITINEFTGDWHGLKINSGSIDILDLETPLLTCNFHSSFPLTSLNKLLQSGALQLTGGDADVVLSYKGPIEKNNNSNSFLNGKIIFKNGKIIYTPRNILMTNVNGLLNFKNSNVIIENIQCNVFNNKITMNGSANNVLSLVNSEPNKVVIDYSIYSPELNLTPFKSLLKVRNKTAVNTVNQFGKMASKLDDLLEKSRINIDLKTDNISYERFRGAAVNADITILQDRYLINNAQINVAGGHMAVKGQLLSIAKDRHQASVAATVDRVNVQELFEAFNNFGQDGISSKNLSGKLTAKANVGIQISSDGKVLPASSHGIIDFSLKKGVLINFTPLKKIQNFIFKKRDFENIEFAELKNKLSINKGEIIINRMEIQSSVFSFFVEGLYSQIGNTDISIQVPLSNLKKRDDDYKPENLGIDKKPGKSIFLRGRPGNDGSIQFKLDLFNKYQKENAVDSVISKN